MRTRQTINTPGFSPRRIAGAAVIATLLTTAGTASAQNALGSGRALDNNLQEGRSYNPEGAYSRSNMAAEIAYRNALVTGNAPNGLSFRESVGYNSRFDFRTEFDAGGRSIPLPSNDIFDFQRDSYSSSIASAGLRGLDSIRQQAAWSTGNLYDEQLNIPIARRAGVGQSGTQLSVEQRAEQEGYEMTFIDPFRLRPRSMRSTTEHTIGAALETRVLGQTRDEETEQIEFLQSTPLRGIVSEMVVTDNMIRLFEGKPIGAPDLVSLRSNDQTTDGDGAETFGYDAVVQRMSKLFNERYAPAEDEGETTPGQPGTTATDSPEYVPAPTADPLDRFRNRLLGIPNEDEEQTEESLEEEGTTFVDSLRQLYSNDTSAEQQKIDRLSPPNESNRNLFAENMANGEALLAKGRWFDAEERFSAALRLSPGDPMAAVGRLHAQLGAGLYLSAGVNFDRLMRANPELMAAKYDERLLPRRGRLQRIDARLRLNTRSSGDLAVSSALLMGYLAHQFDDRLTIEDAFKELDRIHEERETEPDLLETTLREVWLGQ